jgi:bifunctional non-homologous end joining protein LigD
MFSARDLRPMLAVGGEPEPPLVGKDLVYEPKYDGIRAIAEVVPDGKTARVRMWSRNGNEKSAQFPDIVEALQEWAQGLDGTVVLDGEIVAVDKNGRPLGFQRLQHRIHVSVPGYRSCKSILPPEEQGAAFIVFDLLRAGDEDLRDRPLTDRRGALEHLLKEAPPPSPTFRLSEQARGDGRALNTRAKAEGWEGLLVKVSRSPYRSGKRSPEWRKLKLQKMDEFVVGGWTEPQGSRSRFGALILGRYVRSGAATSLVHVGDVGTGFSNEEIERVWKLLKKLETKPSPFEHPPKMPGKAHWVKPTLVAQIRYTEMTDDGRLRHPAYLGMRDDKSVKELKRDAEENDRAAGAEAPAVRTNRGRGPDAGTKVPALRASRTTARSTERRDFSPGDGRVRRTERRGFSPGVSDLSHGVAELVAQLDALEKTKKDGRITLPDGDTLDVTNLAKIFWPEDKRTKGDLLRYYARIAPYILPVIDNRPLVMKRLPNGVEGKTFYQHRAPEPVPPGVGIVTLPDDDVPSRLVGGSLKTLLYMAQLASISMDPWFSEVDALDSADQVAIDLDPQPGATFANILDVARWVHEVLQKVRVRSYPKTSGSEGLHIFIPLPAGTPYDAGRLFCQIVATMVASRHPKVATVTRAVGHRKDGTVYVDYLQNIRGKTLACAYSARASRFAGVSAPLTWEEVYDKPRPQDFTIANMTDRVDEVGDLWAALRKDKGADLLGAIEKLR